MNIVQLYRDFKKVLTNRVLNVPHGPCVLKFHPRPDWPLGRDVSDRICQLWRKPILISSGFSTCQNTQQWASRIV